MSGRPGEIRLSSPVYLVGQHHHHHAKHSGYVGFARYVGSYITPPVRSRYLWFRPFPRLGPWIDRGLARLAGRSYYSTGALLTELSGAVHMFAHPGCVYHLLYGDTDLWLLGHLRKLARTRLVATFHEPVDMLEDWDVNGSLLSCLDAVILLSESQRPYFEALMPPDRIFFVPHGIDTQFFSPSLERSTDLACITVGVHLRDFDTLSGAIDLIRRHLPQVQFTAVGAQSHVKRHFSHPGVTFHEGVDDNHLRQLYRRAQVAIFCLRSATANNAMLEAMACGLPVVATDVGGVRDYLGMQSGVLCPPQSDEAVADSVIRILSNRPLAQQLGEANRRRAETLDYRRVAELMKRVYATVNELESR